VKTIRRRLTYANVMSTIAVFLVVGGATAFAALGKNTVGSKQLKKNAVTTAKIKNNAVTTAKIKAGSVTAGKLGDGSVSVTKLADASITEGKLANGAITEGKLANNAVTGAKINASSTPFSQVVYEARGNATVALPNGGGGVYPLSNGSYTQAANRDDSYMGALDVTFQPGCTAPRTVTAFILVDPANPAIPTTEDIVGLGAVEDKAGGQVSKRLQIGPYLGQRFQSSAPTNHSIYIGTSVSCTAGSGVQATFGGVDVIGTTP